jgi:hypothetical protein
MCVEVTVIRGLPPRRRSRDERVNVPLSIGHAVLRVG